jgi:hypothetical protein
MNGRALVWALSAACVFGQASPESRTAPKPHRAPKPEPPSRKALNETRRADAEEKEAAARLGVSPQDVVAVKEARGLSDVEFAKLSKDRFEGLLKKLRNPLPHHPLEWMRSRLDVWRDENGDIPADAVPASSAAMDALRGGGEIAGLSAAAWEELGPSNIAGRVRSIAVHPTTPSTIFCGSVSGGLWKSVDSGASWAPIDDFLGNLSVSSIVFTPGAPSILYAGTGESFAGDGIRGAGVLKSLDGGATWSILPSTATSDFWFVNRLSFTSDGAALLAATETGIWRSVDGGATFTKVFAGTGNLGSRDVKCHPTLPNAVVADFFDYDFALATWFHAIAYSANGGLTFTQAPGTRSDSYSARIEVAWHGGYTGGGGGCAYAMRNSASGELFRSVDGGATWTLVSSTSILGGTGWYYNALWVDPSDADANPLDDVVLSGGLDMWRSTNGGATFTKITEWFSWPSSPHADHHVVVAHPNFDGASNKTVYIGNDGGVYRTDDVYAAATLSGWTPRNNGLAITQAYGASRCPLDGTIEMGTQDNGTLRYTTSGGPSGWITTFGGDGGFCASDPTDPSKSYGEYIYAQIFRSLDGGVSGDWIDGKYWTGSQYVWKAPPYRIDDAVIGAAEFIAPFVMDPNAPKTLLVGGASLWRTIDADAPTTSTTGPSWASIKGPLASNARITAIAVAATGSNVVWVGHSNGHVFSTTNGLAAAPTWTRRDLGSPNLPNRRVTRITIDPANASRVFVTFGGFNSNNLWWTTDGGATWTAGTGMPAVPLRDVEIGLVDPAFLYVASEFGLLTSDDGGASWVAASDGPATVSIDELFWSGGALYAATHGRGMFRAVMHAASAVPVGVGCHFGISPPPPNVPTLFATPPVMGSVVVLLVNGAPYPTPGAAFLSAPPSAPFSAGGACLAYIDPATAFIFTTIVTTPSGAGSSVFVLPIQPSLVGAQFALQVAFLPSSGGLALTNGYLTTVGY